MTDSTANGSVGAGRAGRGWRRFVALGDSLTAGRGDPDPNGGFIGWAGRLAHLLSERTAIHCELTNLAADGASVGVVLRQQLPQAEVLGPDLASLTVGMNDVRLRVFDPAAFGTDLDLLLTGLASTGATVITCTLPDISAITELPPEYAQFAEIARQRLEQASDIIRAAAARRGALCLDAWAMSAEIADPALFTADMLHPNASGHRKLAEIFAGLLLPA